MSELKADNTFVFGEECLAYKKSEVDKVIAELKAQVNGFYNRANLWEYNARNEHNAAVAVRMENAKLKAKLAKKDKEIAELKEQYKDMDVKHTVHIAKMNAKIDQLEEDVAWNKYKRCLAMADMCNARYDEEDARVNGHYSSWEYISQEMKYWERWRWRWEAIAEKFKEG